MNILISTFGTQGDVVPYLALARGLREAGHTVAVCTSASYRQQIESFGLHYAPMSDEMLELARAMLDGAGRLPELTRRMYRAIRSSLSEEWRAAQEFAPQLIVHHPKMLASPHVAEKLNIPSVISIPLPFYTPTSAYPSPFFAGMPLLTWLNRPTYRLANLSNAIYVSMTNDFRKKVLGLPPRNRFADPFIGRDGTPIPILYPYSPQVLPIPQEYPPHVHVTGYWFLDRAEEWQPPEPLSRFLQSGSAPVYVGFGSMSGKRAKDRAQIVIEALARCGQRGILARGWGGLQAEELPASLYMVDDVPHDWLFPQMAAVVHHGGAGTTAAGLRAGKPTLICPFLGDQPFWGRVVHDSGVGPRPIPQRRLNVTRLAPAIAEAVSSDTMRQRAATLGERIRAEDGIGRAIAVIERAGGVENHPSSRSKRV